MEPWFQMVATIVCAVVASSGFWAYIQKRSEKKDVRTQMLIGLAHDRIVYLGMSYIDRGWITQDEYENLHDYLYKPYEKMGGNGSAKKVMSEVNKLPIHKSTYTQKKSVGGISHGTDYELCKAGIDCRSDCSVFLRNGIEADTDG